MTERRIPDKVDDEENLARFVFQKRHIRSSDGTVKPEAFIPYRHIRLSVTRHIGLSIDEVWHHGHAVSQQRGQPLLARADVRARACRKQRLEVEAAPLADNPNHADVVGWPGGKEEQKLLAIEVARRAQLEMLPG